MEKLVNFTSTLHKLVHDEGLTQDQVGAIAEAIIYNIEEMQSLEQAFGRDDLARSIHRIVDMSVAEQQTKSIPDGTIQCTHGCSHCCRQIVVCSPPEAELLCRTVQQKGLVLDYDKLRRQTGRNDQTWLQQPINDRSCVFLGVDGLCQVYEQRPASCRKYFAISKPELCNIEKYPSQKVAVWFALDAEILTTAMFTEYGCEFLPDLLLKGDEHEKG